MTTIPTPLDTGWLRSRLVENGPYSALDVVTVTGSTNTDLVERADTARDRTVLIAEEQQTGRGRLQRSWVSPRYYGLHVSVLLRPSEIPRSELGWLPLIAGVALAETVQSVTGLPAGLKWPNDLLLGSGTHWCKAAGILAEGADTSGGMAIVLGIGVNVHHGPQELPQPKGGLPPTSLAAQGASVDRAEFVSELLTSFAGIDDLWRSHRGDVVGNDLLDRYQRLCATLGEQVRVDFGDDDPLAGTAARIDAGGRLVVRGADGASTPVAAGDVKHLRPSE
ncbi:BirA family biotin operon repressor/biotin-[acetyl-CoA-carboxylase] ligase [Saccharopolyspora lacisalsi]|uniref:biotin--[biotin carboxyl-carrier protein] ligase n=1 Tax=Halosaccharopolyspora lacisalsi TaxID=1000566 RepID=A0A839DY63_9PSEU|nr:biotin--[acetyl-CoA-carboxylase] ligase [Halosaccharopolyspora lacisalsi]MBA8826902.1 BirA family biotin operon repressor/biotin-[acetyl-CoA-carboxylase] ligase [Halosaccharopolyspora lacisalsi]